VVDRISILCVPLPLLEDIVIEYTEHANSVTLAARRCECCTITLPNGAKFALTVAPSCGIYAPSFAQARGRRLQ